MSNRRSNTAMWTKSAAAPVPAIFGAALVLLLLPRVQQAGTLTTTLQVSAHVLAPCNRSAASDLYFGTMAGSKGVANSNTVFIACDRDTPYMVTCEHRDHERCATRVECFHQPENVRSRDQVPDNTGVKSEAAHSTFHECVSNDPYGPHADSKVDHTTYMGLVGTRGTLETAKAANHVDIVTLTLTY